MRSPTCTHPCTLHCLPRPCDHSVCVAGCSAGTPALSPGRLGCPAGNAEQCAVMRVFVFPSFGLPSSRDQGFLWFVCWSRVCRAQPRTGGVEGVLWMMVMVPTHHLPAFCRSHLGPPLDSVPLPSGLGGQSVSASVGSCGIGAEQSSIGEAEGQPEGCRRGFGRMST